MLRNARQIGSSFSRPRRRRFLVEFLEPRLCLTVPALSSLPGADHTIYLDFDGQTVEGTSWNSYYNQTTLNAPPYDIDGNPGSFNSTELARIQEAWERTAEDFRPFNVNVTTVDPGIEALRKSGSGDTKWGVRAIITNEANMVANPGSRCGCGGIAYIDSFNWSSDTPVWVYTTGGKSIAEAASHEVGHSIGLAHDGLINGSSYYQGHGSGETGWASIMGVGYYQNVTQWDKGEYYNSNNAGSNANYGDGPDDLGIIVGVNGFGYRPDDHGNSNVAASPLSVAGTSVTGGGIIETTSDVDVFSFTTGAGPVSLNIDPFTPGPNLDVKADLYDGAGALVASSNSASVLDASFSLNLPAGQYFLHIDGTGWGNPGANPPSGYSDYGSLGQYSISGSIVDPGGLPQVSISDASADEDAGTIAFTLTLAAPATVQTSVAWSTADGTAAGGLDYQGASGTVTFAAGVTQAAVVVHLLDDQIYEGDETLVVSLSNPIGLVIGDGQAVGTILENDAPPLPTLSISDASVLEGKLNTKGRNAGTRQETDMVFTVTLSTASTAAVTVDFATNSGTAIADDDYVSTASTVTFAPGQTTQTISVVVLGDNDVELDETFTVTLSNPVHATLASPGTATGTVLNDDSSGGGGGKGGGKGGGGKPPKIPSEADPVAIADPLWFFEGPAAGHDHDHHHFEDDHHFDDHHDDHLALHDSRRDGIAGYPYQPTAAVRAANGTPPATGTAGLTIPTRSAALPGTPREALFAETSRDTSDPLAQRFASVAPSEREVRDTSLPAGLDDLLAEESDWLPQV